MASSVKKKHLEDLIHVQIFLLRRSIDAVILFRITDFQSQHFEFFGRRKEL